SSRASDRASRSASRTPSSSSPSGNSLSATGRRSASWVARQISPKPPAPMISTISYSSPIRGAASAKPRCRISCAPMASKSRCEGVSKVESSCSGAQQPPQLLLATLTQVLSHAVLQQYASRAHTHITNSGLVQPGEPLEAQQLPTYGVQFTV